MIVIKITPSMYIRKTFYIIFLSIIIPSFLSNCTKTTQRTVEDQQGVLLKKNTEKVSQELATYFLVRHAEKALEGKNPRLTKEGQERAEELARLLQEIPIDAIYSTDYNRTMETAMPTAKAKKIPIETYDPSDLEAFAASFKRPSTNKKILIVGHSNTTPALINIFANSNQYASLSEKQYDNLYILSSVDRKVVDVLTLKYGQESE